MATVPEQVHESTIGAVSGRWETLLDSLDAMSPWLVVAAYGVVYTVLLVGAATVALSLGALLPGIVGVAAFFTVGLALVAAAPTAARRLAIRTMDAIRASRRGGPGDENAA